MKVLFYKSYSNRNLIVEYVQQQSESDCDLCLKTIDLLERYGFQIPPKNLKKLSGVKGLWELRVSGSKQHRFLFAVNKQRECIMLHVFTKKTQKTPHKHIETALKRLQNYMVHI